MLVNWYANKSSNMVTFPIGVSLSNVQRLGILPVRFAVQGQYMPAWCSSATLAATSMHSKQAPAKNCEANS
jgi:hypothetical protein